MSDNGTRPFRPGELRHTDCYFGLMNKTLSRLKPFTLLPFLCLVSGAAIAAEDSMSPALDDAQIAKILLTANDAEIDAAQLAKKQGEAPAVKNFAEKMISQHKMNRDEAKKITKNAKINPKKNSDAEALEDNAESTTAGLKKLKGAAFDNGYMAQQVSMHEELLKKLDDQLIPAAQNAEFKAYLQKTRGHVATHLEEARAIVNARSGAKL